MRGYVSPGLAAAEGFESGVNLGIKVRQAERDDKDYEQQQRDKAEDRAWTRSERERLGRKYARDEEKDIEERDYTQGKRELEAVDREATTLRTQLETEAQQLGGFDKIDPKRRQDIVNRINEVDGRRRQVQERIYRPIAQRYEKQARDLVTGLQSGSVSLADVSDEDAYRAFAGILRRDPRDAFRGPNGEPSKLGGAIQRVTQGFEGGDQQAILDGAQIILEPELNVGVGSNGPEGTVITGKRLDRFVPSPDGKGFMANLQVDVRGPDGRSGSYFAPVTEGRSGDPKARVVTMDPDKMMDRLGRIGVLEEMINHPELRAKIERGAARLADTEAKDFFTALSVIGAKPGKFTHTNIALGDRTIQQTRNESGRVVEEKTYQRGTSPDTTERTRAAGIRSAGAGQGVRHDRVLVPTGEEDDNGNPIMEERFVQLPTRAGGPAPKVLELPDGARPAPRREPGEDKPADVAKAADNEVARAAGKMGLTWDDTSKRWKSADGKPATQDQVRLLAEVRTAALSLGKKSKGAADSVPKPKMSDADVQTMRDQAKSALKQVKGQPELEKQIRDRFKERTGRDY